MYRGGGSSSGGGGTVWLGLPGKALPPPPKQEAGAASAVGDPYASKLGGLPVRLDVDVGGVVGGMHAYHAYHAWVGGLRRRRSDWIDSMI